MHTTRRRTRTIPVLAIAIVALLTASSAAARGPRGAHSAVRGPGGVARNQTPKWQQSAFGWADGLVVGGVLVALGVGLGYAFVSTRDSPASGPTRLEQAQGRSKTGEAATVGR